MIICPDCGKEISDQAPACIHCGRPMVSNADPVTSRAITGEKSAGKRHSKESCRTCGAWHVPSLNAERGQCRRNAPSSPQVNTPMGAIGAVFGGANFPLTKPSDYCHQWIERESPVELSKEEKRQKAIVGRSCPECGSENTKRAHFGFKCKSCYHMWQPGKFKYDEQEKRQRALLGLLCPTCHCEQIENKTFKYRCSACGHSWRTWSAGVEEICQAREKFFGPNDSYVVAVKENDRKRSAAKLAKKERVAAERARRDEDQRQLDAAQARTETRDTITAAALPTPIIAGKRKWRWLLMAAFGLTFGVWLLVDLAGREGGVWKDAQRDLTWQVSPTGGAMIWSAAKSHCASLSLGVSSGWRLPTINELRSLIRGCPATQQGGSCGVTDSCLNSSCWKDPCKGCSNKGGPGPGGAYWPPELSGEVRWYWSSSPVADYDYGAWGVYFYSGGVYNRYVDYDGDVRCVRGGDTALRDERPILGSRPLANSAEKSDESEKTAIDLFEIGLEEREKNKFSEAIIYFKQAQTRAPGTELWIEADIQIEEMQDILGEKGFARSPNPKK